MPQEWYTIIVGPFQQLLAKVMDKLPGVVAAILLLLVGMLVAQGMRTVVERFLKFIRLDDHTDKVKLNELLARLGFGRSPRQIIGFLVYWLILLVFLVSAANAVELTVVSELLQQFVLFIPKVIAAVLVLAGGLLLGHFVGEIVRNAATANRLDGAIPLSKAAHLVVVVFAAIMALDEIGIDTTIITSSVQIILATVGLGLAIAFGLGGRDAAANIIRGFADKGGNRQP
jgi:hypothetical protein